MLTRMRTAELMDDPALDPIIHAEALRGLGQLNMLSTSADTVWARLKELHASSFKRKIRVLDLATGGGDMPITLYRRAQACNARFEFVGTDISATAVRYAKLNAERFNAPVTFMKLDALTEELPGDFDVVMTSLFTHHLDPPQVIYLLNKMHFL
jgi:methylase of polypeptide subunit release factors